MSKRHGRSKKRRDRAEIETLEKDVAKWSRRSVDKAWAVTQLNRKVEALEAEVSRWRPRITVDMGFSDGQIATTVKLPPDVLRFAPDRNGVVEMVGRQVMEDLHDWLRKTPRF